MARRIVASIPTMAGKVKRCSEYRDVVRADQNDLKDEVLRTSVLARRMDLDRTMDPAMYSESMYPRTSPSAGFLRCSWSLHANILCSG